MRIVEPLFTRDDATSPVSLISLSSVLRIISLPVMTRTTNSAPRMNSRSTVLSSRPRQSAGTDSGDAKHRKGRTSTVNPKNDLDVDFSFKWHTVVRVDEVEGEVEEASEGSGGHSTTSDTPTAQVQLVDLLVPTRKLQKRKGTCTSNVAFI